MGSKQTSSRLLIVYNVFTHLSDSNNSANFYIIIVRMPKGKGKKGKGQVSGNPLTEGGAVALDDMTLEKFKLWSAQSHRVFLQLRKRSIEGDQAVLASRYAWLFHYV